MPMPESKYRVLHPLGSGGMGTIFKGVLVGKAGFQRPIVVKRLRPELEAPEAMARFVEEAGRYAVLDHENIGRIFDFEEVDGRLCMILEHIDGWTLADYLARHRQLGRMPDVDLSVFIVSRVCRALQYVFERSRIVHRDISPSNIMANREGVVKLIDFGIATAFGEQKTLTGKPAYMAPEMITNMRADHRSDLFGLGALLYELLTLRRMFGGRNAEETLEQVVGGQSPSPRAFNPNIPNPVLSILRRAVERDPARRYASAAEMGEACEHHLYDKGFGPTNLTLKEHLAGLFPDAFAGAPTPETPTLADAGKTASRRGRRK
jgi:eukaryotic-like serine/threonine-protein kinase